jgi:hypothetical protein
LLRLGKKMIYDLWVYKVFVFCPFKDIF